MTQEASARAQNKKRFPHQYETKDEKRMRLGRLGKVVRLNRTISANEMPAVNVLEAMGYGVTRNGYNLLGHHTGGRQRGESVANYRARTAPIQTKATETKPSRVAAVVNSFRDFFKGGKKAEAA